MRAKALSLLAILLLAAPAGAQTPAAKTSPQLEEAERLDVEVVRLYQAGRFEEALPRAVRALKLREKELAPADESVTTALVNLASVELRLGKRDEAKGHFRRVVEAFEKAGGGGAPPALITAREGLALLAPHAVAAVDEYQRVLALKEKAYGAESPKLLETLFQLGRLTEFVRSLEESERFFRRFAEIAEKSNAVPAGDVAVAYLRLGCLLGKRGRREEADAARGRAGSLIEDVGTMNDGVVSKPQPDYPVEAKRARAQGTVEVETVVSETGAVVSACARGWADRSLKDASEAAAYKARFSPRTVNSKPVKVRGVITYKFVIR